MKLLNLLALSFGLFFNGRSAASPINFSPKDLELTLPLSKELDAQRRLSKEEVKEDTSLFIYGLLRAYGGVDLIPKSVIDSVVSKIQKINDSMTRLELCQNLGRGAKIIQDGHFQIWMNGTACIHRDFLFKNVGPNSNQSDQHWSVTLRSHSKHQILVIAITRFDPGIWPGFETALRSQMKKADAIIIDLRGNNGGDDSSGYLMAKMIAGQEPVLPYSGSIHRQTAETLTIWKNNLRLKKERLLKNPETNPSTIASLDQYISEADKNLNLALANKLSEFQSVPVDQSQIAFDPQKSFPGPIYILQDKKCGSSCESTIDFFENIPHVVKVGDFTAGMIQFGNVGIFQLKNSGIRVQMATKANLYTDHRMTELVGIRPDIPLEDGQNAMEYVLTLLENSFQQD